HGLVDLPERVGADDLLDRELPGLVPGDQLRNEFLWVATTFDAAAHGLAVTGEVADLQVHRGLTEPDQDQGAHGGQRLQRGGDHRVRRGGVKGEGRAAAGGGVYRGHNVFGGAVDHGGGTEFLGDGEPLGGQVDGDHVLDIEGAGRHERGHADAADAEDHHG